MEIKKKIIEWIFSKITYIIGLFDYAKAIDMRINSSLISLYNTKDEKKRMRIIYDIKVYSRDYPSIRLNTINNIIKELGVVNPSQNQKSIVLEIMEKYDPFQIEISKILSKILSELKNGKLISKKSIQFLTSITDDDLELLKKQFKYVISLLHNNEVYDYGIYRNDKNDYNQRQFFKQEGIFNGQTNNMKFDNIWVYQVHLLGASFLNGNNFNINNINRKNYTLNIKKEKDNDNSSDGLKFYLFALLTELGVEVFELLKNEIAPVPEDFLKKVIEYHQKIHPNFDFQLIQDSNYIYNQ